MKLSPVWLVGATLVVALTAGCAATGHANKPVGQTPNAVAVTTPVSSVATTPSTTTPVAVASAVPTAATSAQQAADLAAINRDLSGIDAGTTQTDGDLGAGDSARAVNDNG